MPRRNQTVHGPSARRGSPQSAEALESIDVTAAKKRLADEQKKLDGISPTSAEYAVQAQRVKVETRRIEVAEQK